MLFVVRALDSFPLFPNSVLTAAEPAALLKTRTKGIFVMQLFSKAILAAALISLGAAAPAIHAQTLNFTLDNTGVLYGAPGSVLHFTGTLSNSSTTDTVFLNGDVPTFTAPGLTLDDSPFSNAPLSLGPLGSGSDTYTGDFFDVTIGSAAQPGTYSGTFEILGGADGNASDVVASHDFYATVLPQAVPEASSVTSLGLMLMLGLGGIVIVRRKKAQLI